MRFSLALIFMGCIIASSSAGAEDGLASMHDKVRVGGKVCFHGHSHAGNSAGHATRKAAEVAAVRNWQDFTAFEYGSAWSSYRLAVGKSMQCSGGGSWGCSIDATPCRSGR